MIKHMMESRLFPLLFPFYLIFLFGLYSQAVCGGVLPDTGQTKCYGSYTEIPCPTTGQPFYGEDGNYQGLQPAYQLSGDGNVVTDLNTGLMWQRADDGVQRDWRASVSYCEELVLSGQSDWRLPNIRELESIVDYGRYNPAINPVFSCQSSYYWSGNTYAKPPQPSDWRWAVHFWFGFKDIDGWFSSFYARCVRGGQ
jgi:hypothetical protein